MKRLIIFLSLLMLLLIVGVSYAIASRQRPYKAQGLEMVVQEAPGGSCGAEQIEVQIEGHGQATHFGQYTITRQHCFDPAQGNFEEGTFVQTAANGDKIYGTYSGVVTDVLEVDDQGNPVLILINGTQEITGGTGQFAGAEGEAELYTEFSLVTHQGDFNAEGWITY